MHSTKTSCYLASFMFVLLTYPAEVACKYQNYNDHIELYSSDNYYDDNNERGDQDCSYHGKKIVDLENNDKYVCDCFKGYYGDFCQYKEKCLESPVPNLEISGYDICEQINSSCLERQEFFRCLCPKDHYFLLNVQTTNKDDEQSTNYTAGCYLIDTCLGVTCKQMSEVCREGTCQCDSSRGYSRDSSGACRLLDTCKTFVNGKPPCESAGPQAKCVPTLDERSFECTCAPGFVLKKDGQDERCEPEGELLCEVPVLNKCHHMCKIDTNQIQGYSCSCFNGFTVGDKKGEDDFMCFANIAPVDDKFSASSQTTVSLLHKSNNQFQSKEDYIKFSEECSIKNEICIIDEDGKPKCQCDRVGYVLVDGICKSWCDAASQVPEYSQKLESTCFVNRCGEKWLNLNHSNGRLSAHSIGDDDLKEELKSYRPNFECSCNISPIMKESIDIPNMCELDFGSIIDPCLVLPNNGTGYTNCVVERKAFCSIFVDQVDSADKLRQVLRILPPKQDKDTSSKDKLQTIKTPFDCVCTPNTRFLHDKPRKKSRCMNGCSLIKNECSRYNRFCGQLTNDSIPIQELFRSQNLISRQEKTGDAIIHSTSSECKCLPGLREASASSHVAHSKATPNLCLLDQDVVGFLLTFKTPSDFNLLWLPNVRLPNGKLIENIFTKENNTDGNEKSILKAFNYLKYLDDDNFESLVTEELLFADINEIYKSYVLIGSCDLARYTRSTKALSACLKFRYMMIEKLRIHFIDWRRVMQAHIRKTIDLMVGDIEVYVNDCEVKMIDDNKSAKEFDEKATIANYLNQFVDPLATSIETDISCDITLHSKRNKVLFEKKISQLLYDEPFNVDTPKLQPGPQSTSNLSENERDASRINSLYKLLSPNLLITIKSARNFNKPDENRFGFTPCLSRTYSYCDSKSHCDQKTPNGNYTCTCKTGYTPIDTRDIALNDSRREICTDIDECLFDACVDVANSTCVNIIGDYHCQCNKHFQGDNKTFCKHICLNIPCSKHGKCELINESWVCVCEKNYSGNDCSILDPDVALRKANSIIVGAIFTSVLILAIAFALNRNSLLKKAKRELRVYKLSPDQPSNLFDLKALASGKSASLRTNYLR